MEETQFFSSHQRFEPDFFFTWDSVLAGLQWIWTSQPNLPTIFDITWLIGKKKFESTKKGKNECKLFFSIDYVVWLNLTFRIRYFYSYAFVGAIYRLTHIRKTRSLLD